MVIHHCLPFADEQRSVKCLGSAAGVSFPSPPLPPAPTFLLLFSQCPRALAPLGLKETETTATQAILEPEFRTKCFRIIPMPVEQHVEPAECAEAYKYLKRKFSQTV